MNTELKKQLDEFREKTLAFSRGELSIKDYKGFSGKYGSYAQRGANASMLRLRMSGGEISKDHLKSIIDICEKYGLNHLHCTTCQTIQLHDIPFDKVTDVMTDAINYGFYTLGGGGDFPRNVMVSPLSGVEKGEYFDVMPYAKSAAEYLISQIDKVKMPRKLKVAFSNSPANSTHATFRDLGFIAREDGNFDVYCAGGMGLNPKMGVKVDEKIEPKNILYYIKAMISLFCEYGNYENRAKARTRYMQDTLGDKLTEEYQKHLKKAFDEGGLEIEIKTEDITKNGVVCELSSRRVIPQKQDGLYTVKFHPIGGNLHPETVKRIYETIKDMDSVLLRVSPDETIYILNCSGNEVQSVLDATSDGGEKDIEQSVSCIGASICQQGLRDSQALLKTILDAVKPYDFPADALPLIHISGCMSSCGTHQIGSIGFHGKVKMVDKKPVAGFTISINGSDNQGKEHFGDDIGVIAADDIPKFMIELGKAVTDENMSFAEYSAKKQDAFLDLINKYI
ncbi:MAG: nitrite/sulfite reductase [Clostridia bacterium]|nr:nitrite/sulfite reductase [Clostridia bacterium]MCI9085921.1 nitrite/sulfite reductase [Clostridia bacterium]